MRRKFRLLAVLAVMGILATGAYAFTAANTVDESSAGFGGAPITGYDVNGISYTLGEEAQCEGEAGDAVNDSNNFGNCVIGVSFSLTGTNEPSNVTVHFAVPDPENLPPHLYSVENGECDITNAGDPGPWNVSCEVLEFAGGINNLRIAAAQ